MRGGVPGLSSSPNMDSSLYYIVTNCLVVKNLKTKKLFWNKTLTFGTTSIGR